jgi:hypothetical protein
MIRTRSRDEDNGWGLCGIVQADKCASDEETEGRDELGLGLLFVGNL